MEKTMKMIIRLLKIYIEVWIYQCINNEYTPKNGDFFWRNDESIL